MAHVELPSLAPPPIVARLPRFEWEKIRDAVAGVFNETSDTYKWALDAVIAHQFGVKWRVRRSLNMISNDSVNRLRAVCKPFLIELPYSN